MKISILLPYKENFAPEYPGAVSLFVYETTKISKFRKKITVFGNTNLKKKFSVKYINIETKKNILSSQTKSYVNKFVKLEKKRNSSIIEIHNRPTYVKLLSSILNDRIYSLYFHNDPLSMEGSKSIDERKFLLKKCYKIIFNSNWSKKRFLEGLENKFVNSNKLTVFYQSAQKGPLSLTKGKKKWITFVGKLNKAKGYDIFGAAVVDILNKYKDWKAVVIGDEEREKIFFKHKNLRVLGFKSHDEVISIFKKSSISVVCSRWEEPFGRTSLESSSCGCAVIITNRGGLPETITNAVIVNNLTKNTIYSSISKLIEKKDYRLNLQKYSLNNFYLTHERSSALIDKCRDEILKYNKNFTSLKKVNLKILHVTNFNERHNGRLFYNTGKRINNGFIRLKHSVLEFSDRDIVSYYRGIADLKGSRKLNKKFIEVIGNYLPDIIVFGHADLINRETIKFIKKHYPNIKMCQWFLDRMDREWTKNLSRFKNKFDLMDANFCTSDPKSLKIKDKNKVFYLPNPVDESFEKLKNHFNKSFNNDVFFAISHGVHRGVLKSGKFDDREIFINKLQKLIPNIKFDLYGMKNNQPIWADNFINRLSQSKMGLNLSQGKPTKYYSSDRFAQLIGNGLLVFIDEKTKFNHFLNNKEIITYKNIKDLAQKINKYSIDNKSRMKISKKGRDKYFKYFNSTLIAEYILLKTYDLNSKVFYWERKLK